MASQWEYKLEELDPDAGTFAQHLNDEGGEGWELVTVVDVDAGRSMQHLVFRRELAVPTWDR